MRCSVYELADLLAADPGRSGLISDFDGTLAEIVEDPGAAAPLPGTPELLASIAASLRLVAVVSGRPLAFLDGALGDAGRRLALFGLYGAERRLPGQRETAAGDARGGAGEELGESWRAVLERAASEIGPLPAGAELETKRGSFALHWRRAPALADPLRALGTEVAARHGLETREAKMALEVLPPGHADKGGVVRALTGELAAACFIGDDVGDLPAFRALEARGKEGLAFARVAVSGAEAPAELLAEADLVLEGPPAVRHLLALLEARLAG